MPTSPRVILTGRDCEILAALVRSPLTVLQLLKLSRTFAVPFNSESRVRGRLQRLRVAGWVRSFPYVTQERGCPADYFQPTLAGYRMLHGELAQLPTKRSFSEIGVARHHHSHGLADFLVHAWVAAHHAGVRVTAFARENTLELKLGDERLWPDASFQLLTSADQSLNFFVELDCSTERLHSGNDADSVARKIRLYNQYQDTVTDRLRVLFVTTRSQERLNHILNVAGAIAHNPKRSLVYGIHLPNFLAEEDALLRDCFRDHRQRAVSLVPAVVRSQTTGLRSSSAARATRPPVVNFSPLTAQPRTAAAA